MNTKKYQHEAAVQEIIGPMPGWILRWGMLVTGTVLIVMIGCAWFFRYPDIVSGKVIMENESNTELHVSIAAGEVKGIQKAQRVLIFTDEYPAAQYGALEAAVVADPLRMSGGACMVQVRLLNGFNTNKGVAIRVKSLLKARVEILAESKSFFSRMLTGNNF